MSEAELRLRDHALAAYKGPKNSHKRSLSHGQAGEREILQGGVADTGVLQEGPT